MQRHALPRAYRILDPGADLRERLRAVLPADVFGRVEWIDRLPEVEWNGVLFANVVLDALPTTRFAIMDGEVMEERVALDADGRFITTLRPADALIAGAVRHLERSPGTAVADGYRSEVIPQLPYGMQAISGALSNGLLLFVDYGDPRREFHLPERRDAARSYATTAIALTPTRSSRIALADADGVEQQRRNQEAKPPYPARGHG